MRSILPLCLCLIAQVSWAKPAEDRACVRGDAYACLRIAMREESNRYAQKAIEVAVKFKTKRNDLASVVAGALFFGTADKTGKAITRELPAVCEVAKMPEACVVILVRDLKAGQIDSQKEARYKSIIKAGCDGGDGYVCSLLSMYHWADDSPEISLSWLKKACDLADMFSCVMLGDSYSTKEKWNDAREIYLKACGAKFQNSCEKVAITWQKQSKPELAKKFSKEKCEEGLGSSCAYHGYLLVLEGHDKEAEEFYRKGCALQDDDSCIVLATDYYSKRKNYGDAKRVLTSGCGRDNPWACYELGSVCLEISDKGGAERAFKHSCDLGYGKGCFGMVEVPILTHRNDTDTIKESDRRYLRTYLGKTKAALTAECNKGSNESCEMLSRLPGLYQKMGLRE